MCSSDLSRIAGRFSTIWVTGKPSRKFASFIPYSFIYMWNPGEKMKQWNKYKKKKKKQIQTHNHREQTDEWQKLRGWVEGEWNRWGGLRGTHKINESLWWNVKHREYSNNILWWQMVTRPHGDHCNVYKYEITIFLKFWANSIHARRE